MAGEKSQASILAKLKNRGADKVLKKHAKDELKYDTGGSLPPFENGIAQLTRMSFGEYETGDNKGQPYFLAMAVIKEPHFAGKSPLRGKQTKVGPIALCDEPKANKGKGRSFEENFAKVQAVVRKLGGEEVETLDELAATMATLVEIGPHFSCRAWVGKPTEEYPNPRVNEVWDKLVPDYVEDESAGGSVEDDTSSNGDGGSDEGSDDTATEKLDADEIHKLVALAATEQTTKNEKKVLAAQEKLGEIARARDIDPDAIDSWEELGEMLLSGSGDDSSGSDDAPWVPEKGSTYKAKVKIDGKEKTIDLKVSAVNEEKETVDGINVATKSLLKGIAWGKIVHD